MRTKKYPVRLSDNERKELLAVISRGETAARKIRRANILLMLDENQQKVEDQKEISKQCHTSMTTIYEVSKQFSELGLTATLKRKKRDTPPIPPKITGDVEARIIALSCGNPPEGYSQWTLRLLADKVVELHIVESISFVSVGSVLKKRIKAASS